MILKWFPPAALMLLSACSSWSGHTTAATTATPAEHYASGKSPLIPASTVTSSNNLCVDNFNFLRLAGSTQYQSYSQDYIKIGNGFNFLNANRNIMGADARDVYTMKLNMKLDALCSKVNYAGYQLIKEKIKELKGI